MAHAERFSHLTYTIRRKVLKIFGASFHVFDPEGNTVFFSKQKAFRLKEDIRLFTDESMTEELMVMRARQIIDFGATYDIVEQPSGEALGSLRRKGMKSLLRDEWLIFDPDNQPIGVIREDSSALAVIRRFVENASFFLPQKFHVEVGGQVVCTFAQNFNPFVQKLTVDFTGDEQMQLDPRLGLAAGMLIMAIEGRQG
jgi:uncharacterized protein YxjI